MRSKVIQTKHHTFHTGRPSLCLPVTGKTDSAVLEEAVSIQHKKPDLVEWRADFFEDLSDIEKVEDTAARMRESLQGIPLLFTIRSEKEGGQTVSLTAFEKMEWYRRLSIDGNVDMMDYEIQQDEAEIKEVQSFCRKNGVLLLFSYHNFSITPSEEEMLTMFKKIEDAGADMAKIAVMPETMNDVLSLLNVTLKADEELDIPVITMSMGKMGAVSRLAGWQFGSLFTFAVGSRSSAPGQIPVEMMRELEGYLI
ncbi:type I 3-dehydroquinate dehydratase [Salibacterium sp. K-3]